MPDAMPLRTRTQTGLAEAERKDQYLAFQLGSETFAMSIGSIREVIQYGALTVVPLMPGFVRGVINLRGVVVPVLDLEARFGRGATQVGRRTCIVIVEAGAHVLGILVDSVSEVLELGAEDIERPPAFGSSLRTEFLVGVGKVNDHFVLLLAVDKVLDVEELAGLAVERGALAVTQP